MTRIKVLIVDDAAFIRDLVKKELRSYFPNNMDVDDAVDGHKAQQLLQHNKYDLILCDWEMPEMSGLELLRWCNATGLLEKMPFIMVTSRSDKENVVQAIQAGVSDYIGKPFSTDQLIGKVRKALVKVGLLDAASLPSGSTATAKPHTEKAPGKPMGRGQGQLRLSHGNLSCVVKGISLKEAVLIVKKTQPLPQILESAVLDLEHSDNTEIARLNGYLHSLAAFEPKPDSEWILVNFHFVDADPKKLDYLSRLITSSSLGH